MTPQLWKVAVSAPLREPLTYQSPIFLERGHWVELPLGRRKAVGLVLGQTQEQPDFDLKEISSIDSRLPKLTEPYIKWLEWLSDYYQYPLGLVVDNCRPPLAKREGRGSRKSPVVPKSSPSSAPPLTQEQSQCIQAISQQTEFQSHLVHGVTGSGKTEIYLQLIEKTLAAGKSALVLVPEISLTPQLMERFASRFGDDISAYHSQMTPREKTDHWWQIVSGQKRVMIGARSALFCPHSNLGLIVVDEEHEPSYKQDDKLKYHARDAAVMLARFHNCPIVLGSATPSLESWENAQSGKYRLHQLKKRVHDSGLPQVQVVDLRQNEGTDESLPHWLSKTLHEKMSNTLERGEQVALFLNRRGMANSVLCNSCGYSAECPNCDIHLTLHSRSHLVCHYCDYHENLKTKCPQCPSGEMVSLGLGTEKLEEDLVKLFPDKVVARADRDEIQNRDDLESFIKKVESGEADILVGTQMIAKGLDFPNLKLVGLVLADIGFNLPDFRATERSFQLMVQMSGRSGRKSTSALDRGEVVIQTYNPDHECLKYALEHDFMGFSENELRHRKVLNYPPFGRLASLRIQSTDKPRAQKISRLAGERARALQQKYSQYESLEILGPAESPLAKLKGQFRYHLFIKGPKGAPIQSFMKQLVGDESWVGSRTRVIVDIDPLHLI